VLKLDGRAARAGHRGHAARAASAWGVSCR